MRKDQQNPDYDDIYWIAFVGVMWSEEGKTQPKQNKTTGCAGHLSHLIPVSLKVLM